MEHIDFMRARSMCHRKVPSDQRKSRGHELELQKIRLVSFPITISDQSTGW